MTLDDKIDNLVANSSVEVAVPEDERELWNVSAAFSGWLRSQPNLRIPELSERVRRTLSECPCCRDEGAEAWAQMNDLEPRLAWQPTSSPDVRWARTKRIPRGERLLTTVIVFKSSGEAEYWAYYPYPNTRAELKDWLRHGVLENTPWFKKEEAQSLQYFAAIADGLVPPPDRFDEDEY